MSVALAYEDYTSFQGRINDTGASADSKTVLKMYKDTLSHLLQSVTEGQRLREALNALDEIYKSCNQEGWDGYDASPITERAYNEAIKLICLLPSAIPMPEIVPEPTGDIALEWYRGRQHVFLVSCAGKGAITYAGLFGLGNKAYGREYFGESLPSILVKNINRLSE